MYQVLNSISLKLTLSKTLVRHLFHESSLKSKFCVHLRLGITLVKYNFIFDTFFVVKQKSNQYWSFHSISNQTHFYMSSTKLWKLICILCQDKLRNLWTALKLQPRFALEHVYRYLQEKRRGLINEQEAGAIVKVTVKLWSFDQSRAARKRVVKHTTTIIPYVALC